MTPRARRDARTTFLPPADYSVVLAAEEDAVIAALDGITDPASRLAAAATLNNLATMEFERLVPLRNRLALSLSFYDYSRGLAKTLGVTRARFHELRCAALGLTAEERSDRWLKNADRAEVERRARESGVVRYPRAEAERRLREVSEQALRAERRASVARRIRDVEVHVLLRPPYEWTHSRIADVIQRNSSRISHIKKRGVA